jgi:hypothetical protein
MNSKQQTITLDHRPTHKCKNHAQQKNTNTSSQVQKL